LTNKYRIIIHAKKIFAVLVISEKRYAKSEKQKAETFKNKCFSSYALSVFYFLK